MVESRTYDVDDAVEMVDESMRAMLSSADWVKSARFAARSAEYDGALWRCRTAVAAYVVVDVGAVESARRGICVVAVTITWSPR